MFKGRYIAMSAQVYKDTHSLHWVVSLKLTQLFAIDQPLSWTESHKSLCCIRKAIVPG